MGGALCPPRIVQNSDRILFGSLSGRRAARRAAAANVVGRLAPHQPRRRGAFWLGRSGAASIMPYGRQSTIIRYVCTSGSQDDRADRGAGHGTGRGLGRAGAVGNPRARRRPERSAWGSLAAASCSGLREYGTVPCVASVPRRMGCVPVGCCVRVCHGLTASRPLCAASRRYCLACVSPHLPRYVCIGNLFD